MNPLDKYADIQAMVQKDARDIASQVYRELGSQYGVPEVPYHIHMGTDSPKINYNDLLNIPATPTPTPPGLSGIQAFSASGTFTVPDGFTNFWVRQVGGGQGGGHVNASDSVGSPGAGADYCEDVIDLTGVATVTVTIGAGGAGGTSGGADGSAGGDTTFGSYLLAKGGASSSTTTGTTIVGGYPGPTPSFRLSATGTSTNVSQRSAVGGSSFFGSGAVGVLAAPATETAGGNAVAYGSGGSGGASGTAGLTANGGSGKSGYLIVIW